MDGEWWKARKSKEGMGSVRLRRSNNAFTEARPKTRDRNRERERMWVIVVCNKTLKITSRESTTPPEGRRTPGAVMEYGVEDKEFYGELFFLVMEGFEGLNEGGGTLLRYAHTHNPFTFHPP